MRKQILVLLFVVLVCQSFGQSTISKWTDYLSYSSAQKVINTGELIYCSTSGGLFTFDKTDNSLLKLTGINGLSDVGIHTIAYGEESGIVLIAYDNSNIDLIDNNKSVFNLSDIKRKQIVGDKKIYNVLFVGQTAYLSCGFGIVAVNLEKREIKDTYFIGNNGSSVVVLDMTFDGQYLYAGTQNGIFRADINSSNLQDFQNWEHLNNIPHADGTFNQLEFFDEHVIANYFGGNSDSDELYQLEGENWNLFLPVVTFVKDMQVNGSTLVLARMSQVDIYDPNETRLEKVDNYSFSSYSVNPIHASSAILDDDGILWIADLQEGLIKKQGENFDKLLPEGPADNRVFSLFHEGNDLWVSTGGRNAAWNNIFNGPQFQLFRNGNWNTFNENNHPELAGFHDIVCVTVDPNDPDHVFAGSWGGGIIEFQGNEFINRYNQFNSSLQTALPSDPNPNFVRIGGMDFDSQGNLWATNALVGEPLSVFKPDGTWESFGLNGIPSNYVVGQIQMTENDDQWIVLPRGNDLFVRKSNGSDFKRLQLTSYFNNGSDEIFTRLNDIYSIALDNEGAIWLGTSKGVAVYYNPEDIWEQSNFYASQPGLDLNDGIYHPLLETETVTAIAVDGANQKWFGTKNSGAFLISKDGENEQKHFTETNSPLLSNEIISISINHETGEVFFGTDKGMISYMGGVTAGSDDYEDVYAYPNPVRENYEGDIVITGLIENTDVKITDISGNLVFTAKSQGGQAIWDGRNTLGKRVSTGVYMVFGNDLQGEKTFVTKILFIH